MMMRKERFKVDHFLYGLAFALALAVRFLNLGAAPLSELESSWALQALAIAQGAAGTEIHFGPQPAYLALTALGFFLVKSTEFLARFWPALSGSLLALAPALFAYPHPDWRAGGWRRIHLGRAAGVILAFGLALDPGLTAASRLAGGPVMAVSFGVLAVGLWRMNRPVLAGVSAGVGLLSGPAFLIGALSLVLPWLAARQLLPAEAAVVEGEPGAAGPLPSLAQAGIAALITVLSIGTLFLSFLPGLAAFFASFSGYLSGWVQGGGAPALLAFVALLVYQPLALVFALLVTVQALAANRKSPFAIAQENRLPLVVWLAAALLLVLLYPARQVYDLVWVLVPLWTLAAIGLAQFLPGNEYRIVALAQAALVVVLLGLLWFNLAALSRAPSAETVDLLRFGVMAGIVILIVMVSVLTALGWSLETGVHGLGWGAAAGGLLYLVSVLWGATQVRPNAPVELWSPGAAAGQERLMLETLETLSSWQTGLATSMEVVVSSDSNAMRWALRDFPQAHFVAEPAIGELPPVLITSQSQAAPALAAAYRGQDFTWRIYPGWNGALPNDFVHWLAFREAPLQEELVILWARSDIFPGGSVEDEAITP